MPAGDIGMEQKRTLWIVLAAGFFLLVVIGAALILYAPDVNRNSSDFGHISAQNVWMAPSQSPEQPQKEVSPLPRGTDAEPYVAEQTPVPSVPSITADLVAPAEAKETSPAQDTKQVENLTVIAQGTTKVYGLAETPSSPAGTTTIDLNAPVAKTESNVTPQNKLAADAMSETRAAVRIQETQTAASPRMTETKTTAASEKAPVAKSTSSTKTATKSSSTATKKVPVKTAAAKIPDRYWVQAASYSDKKNADEARAVLDENKIQCEVFTYTDAKNVLHYRVRVGPYTTKSEAEYWKKRIESLPQFAKTGSYVTNSSAKAAN